MCESNRVESSRFETLLLLSCSDFDAFFHCTLSIILHVFYTKMPFHRVVSSEKKLFNAKCAVMLWLYFFFHVCWLVNYFSSGFRFFEQNSAFHLWCTYYKNELCSLQANKIFILLCRKETPFLCHSINGGLAETYSKKIGENIIREKEIEWKPFLWFCVLYSPEHIEHSRVCVCVWYKSRFRCLFDYRSGRNRLVFLFPYPSPECFRRPANVFHVTFAQQCGPSKVNKICIWAKWVCFGFLTFWCYWLNFFCVWIADC